MAGFRFDSIGGAPSPEGGGESAVDALISAAGGAPLPGVFGVAQAIANAWTAPASGPRWLRYAKSSLMSAGVILAYKRSKEPPKAIEKRNPITEYMAANDMVPVAKLSRVTGFAYYYLCQAGGFVDEKIGDDCFGRRFPGGIMGFFYSAELMNDSSKEGWGPAVLASKAGREAAAVEAVRSAVWEGCGGDIDFSITGENTWGDPMFVLAPLPPPGDFVDRPENGETAVLGQLADRCQRFNAKGLRRGLLFYGAPGCGKTTLARHLARQVGGGRALRLDPEAVSRCNGGRLVEMIRLLRPTVVLLDDLDRADGVDGLLSLVADADGVPVIVATVNAVDRLDPALLRPGRFDEVIEVSSPSSAWLREIAEHYVQSFGAVVDLDDLMPKIEGFAPAELREILQVVAIVGSEVLDLEVERVRRQRQFYGGESISRFLSRRDKS